MQPNEASNPTANPVISLREEVVDWAVLFNLDTAAVQSINPVGVVIWRQMDGQHSLVQIVAELKNHYTKWRKPSDPGISTTERM